MNQRMNQTVNVVKIGGNIINDPIALNTVLDHFARLDGPRVLIHGGGKLATELAGKLGIPQTMVQGRRVTDQETLRIAVMVYGGLINKSIVAGLQARGVPAVGVSGADLDLIRAERRNPVPVDYAEYQRGYHRLRGGQSSGTRGTSPFALHFRKRGRSPGCLR